VRQKEAAEAKRPFLRTGVDDWPCDRLCHVAAFLDSSIVWFLRRSLNSQKISISFLGSVLLGRGRGTPIPARLRRGEPEAANRNKTPPRPNDPTMSKRRSLAAGNRAGGRLQAHTNVPFFATSNPDSATARVP
jgi:hypothetical protein